MSRGGVFFISHGLTADRKVLAIGLKALDEGPNRKCENRENHTC
jgi:hypothetical protein